MTDHFRAFYESVGEKYPEDFHVYRSLSGVVRRKWILHKLQALPGGNLLDCGCNTGILSRGWSRGSVFGIDIAYAVLARGKQRAPRINFIQADLRWLSMLRPGCIDNAIACEVIEHLNQPVRFLQGLYHAMKESGHILITSPNYSRTRPKQVPLGIMRSYGVLQGTSGEEYLHTAYKPDELARMTQQAGFKILEQGSFEYELRGWLKPLTIMETAFTFISRRFFPSSRFNLLFEKLISRIELNAFTVLDTFFLSRILHLLFRQGRRSYIVAKK
jgi:2-polyprenyl-3-methyl-5-hydroxy-6-metoxy-1,4-benzoquinol methylase